MKAHISGDAKHGFEVWASDPIRDYKGPVADVYTKDKWLFIVTDPYEGAAMLNIEALPKLRSALAKLDKARRERLMEKNNAG